MKHNCCESTTPGTNINVNVDVPKIVKYICVAGVLIVGIIFGTNCYKHMIEK